MLEFDGEMNEGESVPPFRSDLFIAVQYGRSGVMNPRTASYGREMAAGILQLKHVP